MAGRPTIYTDKLAREFCSRYATTPKTVKQICQDEDMPCNDTIWRWKYENPTFSDLYARAREAKMDIYAEENLDIADDGSNDWMEIETKSGRIMQVVDREHVSRSQLRIRTREWQIERLARSFSPKSEQVIEHNGLAGKTLDELRQLAMPLVKVKKK